MWTMKSYVLEYCINTVGFVVSQGYHIFSKKAVPNIKKFKIVHFVLFQTQTELTLINFTMKWIILWTYIKIAHQFYYELIKIKFTNFELLKVILLWNGLLILSINYKYILWTYLQTYTIHYQIYINKFLSRICLVQVLWGIKYFFFSLLKLLNQNIL